MSNEYTYKVILPKAWLENKEEPYKTLVDRYRVWEEKLNAGIRKSIVVPTGQAFVVVGEKNEQNSKTTS